MALIKQRPITPGQRFRIKNAQRLSTQRPEATLIVSNHRAKGRNCYGRITSRRRGGGHKRLYRLIDFKREKFEIPAKILAIEYDPNRSANIALLVYADGEKRYIIAPGGLTAGDVVMSTLAQCEEYKTGWAMRLRLIPPATFVHCIELIPGKGAQIARGAGIGAQLIAIEGDRATLKMPSGEIRYVHADCQATIGTVGNQDHHNAQLGKAGRRRWLGRRPKVRGVAMNPVDHPMGGGQGKTSGGGHPVSPWGQLSKKFPTRKRSKPSNSMILIRCNGRKVKH